LFWRAINIKFGHAKFCKIEELLWPNVENFMGGTRPLHWPHLPPRLCGLDFEPLHYKFLATPLPLPNYPVRLISFTFSPFMSAVQCVINDTATRPHSRPTKMMQTQTTQPLPRYSQYIVRLMAPRVWRTLASATQALWPTFGNHRIYQLQPAETEGAMNVVRLLSAETECPPKVPIYPHSVPKPKPKPRHKSGQWVSVSNGSTNVNGSRGSWVSTVKHLTHD